MCDLSLSCSHEEAFQLPTSLCEGHSAPCTMLLLLASGPEAVDACNSFCEGDTSRSELAHREAGGQEDLARLLDCSALQPHTYHAPLFTALILDYADMLKLLLDQGLDPAAVQPEWLQARAAAYARCLPAGLQPAGCAHTVAARLSA